MMEIVILTRDCFRSFSDTIAYGKSYLYSQIRLVIRAPALQEAHVS